MAASKGYPLPETVTSKCEFSGLTSCYSNAILRTWQLKLTPPGATCVAPLVYRIHSSGPDFKQLQWKAKAFVRIPMNKGEPPTVCVAAVEVGNCELIQSVA